ncbi:hypothetical protein WJX74_006340 [Apatococcus lobatus]|uniref:DNA polymerase n=1 Tax=Apatococcus lobatus TaxID=904363 RepID=A0AAW1R0T3_9CHLO
MPPPRSKQRTDAGPYLRGVVAAFDTRSIENFATRSKVWTRQVCAAGGKVTKDTSEATHLITGIQPSKPGLTAGGSSNIQLVRDSWLVQSLAEQTQLPAQDFAVDTNPAVSEIPDVPAEMEAHEASSSLKRFARWLGRWSPELDAVQTQNEIVLQANFPGKRCACEGNRKILAALRELTKYEAALGESGSTLATGGDASETLFNYRALRYSRMTAVVCASAFEVGPDLEADSLPFLGEVGHRQVLDIACRGSCSELDEHRANDAVHRSDGRVRPEAYGGRARYGFARLPGVGAATAKRWYDLEFRSYEDLDEAIAAGQAPSQLQPAARFSLAHRHDLLEPTPRQDLEEMLSVVSQELKALAGPGWEMEVVGGGAREEASHDADFVLSHPSMCVEGVVRPLCDRLWRASRLARPADGLCQIQEGRISKCIENMKAAFCGTSIGNAAQSSNLAADRFDRVFGNFKTKAGKWRRMDLIFVPHEQLHFGLLGWTGSKQFLRFMRAHAGDRGMLLNSHGLLVKDEGRAWLVPSERPPRGQDGALSWPVGWHAMRPVSSQQDIFELLGLPYRTPAERNCP